jgi:hypothetical protein
MLQSIIQRTKECNNKEGLFHIFSFKGWLESIRISKSIVPEQIHFQNCAYNQDKIAFTVWFSSVFVSTIGHEILRFMIFSFHTIALKVHMFHITSVDYNSCIKSQFCLKRKGGKVAL